MSRNVPGLILTYTAVGEIPARVVVKHGANDGEAAVAASASDALLGVSSELARANGQHVDVIRSGVTPVLYGAAIARGAALTANSSGAAIPAKANDQIIGYAEISGSAGDIGSIAAMGNCGCWRRRPATGRSLSPCRTAPAAANNRHGFRPRPPASTKAGAGVTTTRTRTTGWITPSNGKRTNRATVAV